MSCCVPLFFLCLSFRIGHCFVVLRLNKPIFLCSSIATFTRIFMQNNTVKLHVSELRCSVCRPFVRCCSTTFLFDLSSVAPANRNETTWLVSRVPPLSCRAHHSRLSQAVVRQLRLTAYMLQGLAIFCHHLIFRHLASSIQDRRFATFQRTLFIYLIKRYISLSDICLTVHSLI